MKAESVFLLLLSRIIMLQRKQNNVDNKMDPKNWLDVIADEIRININNIMLITFLPEFYATWDNILIQHILI